jgi:hypothetical protein
MTTDAAQADINHVSACERSRKPSIAPIDVASQRAARIFTLLGMRRLTVTLGMASTTRSTPIAGG